MRRAVYRLIRPHQQGDAVLQKKRLFIHDGCNRRIGRQAHCLRCAHIGNMVRATPYLGAHPAVIDGGTHSQRDARPAGRATHDANQH